MRSEREEKKGERGKREKDCEEGKGEEKRRKREKDCEKRKEGEKQKRYKC